MQDILDHLTELTAAEPADVAAEKPRKVGHNHLAAAVEAELPVARPGEVLSGGGGQGLADESATRRPRARHG